MERKLPFYNPKTEEAHDPNPELTRLMGNFGELNAYINRSPTEDLDFGIRNQYLKRGLAGAFSVFEANGTQTLIEAYENVSIKNSETASSVRIVEFEGETLFSIRFPSTTSHAEEVLGEAQTEQGLIKQTC